MSETLLDNDIALKISQYSLVDEFFSVCTHTDKIYVLPSLKYVFHLSDDTRALRRVGDLDTLNALKKVLLLVDELSTQPYADLLANFQDVDQIDPGEAVLFSIAAMWEESITITGDKRALIALSSICGETCNREILSGRLKCLEQIVAEMVLSEYRDAVIGKITGQIYDTALRICFSHRDYDNVMEGLYNYYHDLNKQCSEMLAPFPDY